MGILISGKIEIPKRNYSSKLKKWLLCYFQINNSNLFKLKASTIVETLIASIIIIIIFSIASLTLNNVFKATIKKDTTWIDYRINKLSYLLQNDKLSQSYFETYKGWNIRIINSNKKINNTLSIQAIKESKQTNKIFANVGF